MNSDDLHKIVVRNRIIDLYLIYLSLTLLIPHGAFHFVSLEPITDSTVVFSFVFLEFWFISIFGVFALIHHGRKGWQYKNVNKSYFLIVCSMFLVYFCSWLFSSLFFPNLPDCIMSRIWNTNPCTDVDFDGNLSFFYVLGGTCIFTAILFLFPINVAKKSNLRENIAN